MLSFSRSASQECIPEAVSVLQLYIVSIISVDSDCHSMWQQAGPLQMLTGSEVKK